VRVLWLVVAFAIAGGETAAAEPALVGWWRSPDVCLQLFANGDFELSVMSETGPKLQAMGAALVTGHGSDYVAKLDIQRVWASRYIGVCHKTNISGRWIDKLTALGRDFATKTKAELTIKRIGDTQIEVCATACARLDRAEPKLAGKWRRAKLDDPAHPTITWGVGEVIYLDLASYGAYVWVGTAAKKFDEITGTSTVRYVAPDRFDIELAIDKATRHFTVTRLTGERLSVCEGTRCGVLDHEFDSSSTDLD
jgi:hypothetical protein